jgi:3-hydroxyphenylacetate 6-hydroxylase
MISLLISLIQIQAIEHPFRSVLSILFLLPFTYLLANEVTRKNARLEGFDGPRGLWIVGNIPSIRVNAAEKYREWARKYGAVYQIQLGNEVILVVNTAEAARVLFGQFSQALSSRPVFYTFHKVCIPEVVLVNF